jgi:hypothetical protein
MLDFSSAAVRRKVKARREAINASGGRSISGLLVPLIGHKPSDRLLLRVVCVAVSQIRRQWLSATGAPVRSGNSKPQPRHD